MADGYIGVKKLQQRTVSEDIAEVNWSNNDLLGKLTDFMHACKVQNQINKTSTCQFKFK